MPWSENSSPRKQIKAEHLPHRYRLGRSPRRGDSAVGIGEVGLEPGVVGLGRTESGFDPW